VQRLNSTAVAGSGSVVCDTMSTNTGLVAASEVVQLYVEYLEAAKDPPKLLKAFVKVHLTADQSTDDSLQVPRDNLRI
jgi:beta-glucosidase